MPTLLWNLLQMIAYDVKLEDNSIEMWTVQM